MTHRAIQTHILKATKTRPDRVRASLAGFAPLVLPLGRLAGAIDPHRAAAVALCRRHGWAPFLVSGELPNGDVAHVWAQELPKEGT